VNVRMANDHARRSPVETESNGVAMSAKRNDDAPTWTAASARSSHELALV
jgi:hypothetical protein